MTVQSDWIDYNGHLNMAYYNVLFDRGADAWFEEFGVNAARARDTGLSTFSAEFHVCYLHEVHEGDHVYVTSQLLDFDEKRFHFFQQLHHEDGWVSATGEGMGLHIDLSGPKVTAMPPDLVGHLQRTLDAHSKLPRPERAGRRIGIPRG